MAGPGSTGSWSVSPAAARLWGQGLRLHAELEQQVSVCVCVWGGLHLGTRWPTGVERPWGEGDAFTPRSVGLPPVVLGPILLGTSLEWVRF